MLSNVKPYQSENLQWVGVKKSNKKMQDLKILSFPLYHLAEINL